MGFGRKLLVGTVVVVGGLYTAGWFAAQHYADQFLEARASRADGKFHCDKREIHGFPLSFDVSCKETALAFGGGGIKAEVAGVRATAPLLKLGRVEAHYQSPAKVESLLRGFAGEAKFTSASNSADMWIDGARRIAGEVENFDLTLTGPRAGPVKSLAVAKGNTYLATSAVPNSLDVSADLKSLRLVRASGPALPPVDVLLRATLVDIGGAIRDDAQFGEWLRSGGRLRVDEATLTAQQSSISISGDLTVASNGLVSGRARLRLVGIAALPDLAESIAPGSRGAATQAAGLISAMTRLVQTEKGPAQEIDVIIANGAVLVGVIPLPVTIPPLF